MAARASSTGRCVSAWIRSRAATISGRVLRQVARFPQRLSPVPSAEIRRANLHFDGPRPQARVAQRAGQLAPTREGSLPSAGPPIRSSRPSSPSKTLSLADVEPSPAFRVDASP